MYLGGLLSKNKNCEDDIKRSIRLMLLGSEKRKIWKDKRHFIKTKVNINETTFMLVLFLKCWSYEDSQRTKDFDCRNELAQWNTESFKTAENKN